MILIIIKENENFESSLRKFKKLCDKSNIIENYKKSEFYEKPATIRKKYKLYLKKKFKNIRKKK